MRRTIDIRRPSWPPRPWGHPVAPRLVRAIDGRDLPGRDDHVIDPFAGAGTTTNDLEQSDERSR